jgi:hypothetical protein
MTPEYINDRLTAAIDRFLAEGRQLLESGVREEALCHHLADELQQEFPDWDVDTEYDKLHVNGIPAAKKYISSTGKTRTAIPDIIVHHRQTAENLLVVEIKRLGKMRGREEDRDKLRAYKLPPYSYQFAVFLELGMKDGHPSASVEFR